MDEAIGDVKTLYSLIPNNNNNNNNKIFNLLAIYYNDAWKADEDGAYITHGMEQKFLKITARKTEGKIKW